jgi:O-antigen/teichoic acid export membrane protein
MGKAGFTSISHWYSLLIGRSAAASVSHHRITRVLQGLITAIAGKGVSVIVGLISVPLTVGYLGAERYGMWMTISTLLAWLSLADLGLGNSLTNAVSEAYASDRRDQAQIHIASVFWMLCLVAAGFAGLAAILWRWIDWSSLLNVQSAVARGEIGPAIAVTLGIFLLSFPLSIIARVLCAYQESAIANFWAAGGNIASLGGIILATHFKMGLVPLIAAFSASSLIVTAACGIWLFGFHKPWLRPAISAVRMESIKKLTTVGGMFFIVQIAALLILQTDNLIIAHYLGAQAVTPYSVTWRLFNCSTLVQALLLQSLWPAYAEAFARNDGKWIRRTFRVNSWICILITIAMVLPLVIYGRPIIGRWVSVDAVPSMTLLVLMGVWSIIGGVFQSIVCMLNGIGRVKIQMIVGIITATANIGLSIWLVRILGVEGVILGTLISYFVFALIPVWIATKKALASLPDGTSTPSA